MKKNLFIILGIFLIIIAFLVYFYYNTIKIDIISQSINREYEQYLEENILGSTLMTLINKASNQNEKNGIEKDEKNTYIENDTNSIKIEVKFLESDKTFSKKKEKVIGKIMFILVKNY